MTGSSVCPAWRAASIRLRTRSSTLIDPIITRSADSVVRATDHPWPSSPITWSPGMRTSSRCTSLKWALRLICTIGRTSMPGDRMSTTKYVMPAWRQLPGSVRASRMAQSALAAPLVQTFWPVTIQSSPSGTARVRRLARSEPASGSLNSWHQT